MINYLSYIFIFLAAIFNSLMDIFENENFFNSIFYNKNQKYWYKRESWKYANKIFGWKNDAWHLAKSSMILCLMLSILFYKIPENIIFSLLDFIIINIIWDIIFNIFYNYIWKKRK